MDAGRVGRLCRTPMMKHFNQLLAKQFDPVLFDLIGVRSSIRLAPLFGVLLDRRALSGGLRFARPPAIGWQPFRLPVPQPSPVGRAVHNSWNSPHEISSRGAQI